MAYNLEPLIQILEQILHSQNNHRWILDPQKKPEIESLHQKACFLKQLFKIASPLRGSGVERLGSQIRDAVHEAENILESHMVDKILWARADQSFTLSPPSLQNVVEQLNSAGKEIQKMMDMGTNPVSSRASPPDAQSSRSQDPNPKKILVGISKDLDQLKDRLTGQPPQRQIIPIVGMGGIGKTTLARKVYDDPAIAFRFDTRAWITVSQDYDDRAVLLGLLRCLIGEITDEMLEERNAQLAQRLYQSLCGKRYLIVLDDLWDIKAWDDTRKFFPEYNNGSRILITTREMNVAHSAASSDSAHHEMNLLSKDESWNLLREKVFGQEIYPPIFQEIGKKIAKNCGGLPLAIHVVGGFLSQTNITEESWSQVADDVGTVGVNKDEQFSKILSLSYNNLPNHLKPCFLYLSAFPEDYDIRASRVIRLWVAEGFLKPISGRSPEEAAQLYLKALVDRNLIFTRQRATNGKVKSYGLHDLLRDLCMRKACEDKFLYVKNRQLHSLPENTHSLRRVSVQTSSMMRDLYGSMSLARSFLCVRPASRMIASKVILGLRLVRTLDVLEIKFLKFPQEILQMFNLRYLALACNSNLPDSISVLCNLQTLIFTFPCGVLYNSYKLLGMPQLRHIKFNRFYSLDDFSYRRNLVCENIQTLSTIEASRDFVSNVQAMPNLRKLRIFVPSAGIDYDIDLSCLSKLESLKCSCFCHSYRPNAFLSLIIFPPSLKKLTLNRCAIPLGYMGKIAVDLPNLKVLKLQRCPMKSPTWDLAAEEVEEFSNLKVLLLQKLKLVDWIADKTQFPRLKRLLIRHCRQLKEIPSDIGDITTLELIEMHNVSPSAAYSARKIREEQIENGNEDLQVRISIQRLR